VPWFCCSSTLRCQARGGDGDARLNSVGYEQEFRPAGPVQLGLEWHNVLRPYRVIVAKLGLDGHDRGAKIIARALRDAGFEVIYTGLFQTPEQVAATALQEDVDAVGISMLSNAHNTLFPLVVESLKQSGLDDVVVFGGGVIPEVDIQPLKDAGVANLFTPGTPIANITEWLTSTLDEREQARA